MSLIKKVLITGASGMVGRNLAEHPDLAKFQLLTPTSGELNLLSYQSVQNYLRVHQVDLIIHCAGRVGGIQANIKNPVAFFVENQDMGRNIIMAARESGVRHLLNMASSCMYPRNAESPLKESFILTGELEPTNEGYALAKISTTKLCQYIRKEDPLFMYKTLIPCNLYGRWDKFSPEHSHMVPAVISKIHEAKVSGAKTVDIWGDGMARREFMYTGDLADFVKLAISQIETLPDLMNVGLGYDFTINEYYEAIAKVIGYEGSFQHDLSRPVGMKRKMVDVSLQAQYGWSPKTKLIDGIKKTYQFYLEKVI